MRLREMFTGARLAAAAVGVGAFLSLTVGACAGGGGTTAGPSTTQDGQTAARSQLPSLDVNVTAHFQTATFAFG